MTMICNAVKHNQVIKGIMRIKVLTEEGLHDAHKMSAD